MHFDLGAVIDVRDGGLFEQLHAQLLCGSRFTQRQVQRMQVSGAHVDQTADVALGTDDGMHFTGLQQSGFIAITEAAQFFGIFGKTFKVSGLVGQIAVTPGQVAGNLKTLDPLSDDFHGFKPHEFHLTHTVRADHVGELIEAVADAANQLPAVASAGAPTDLVGFEQHHAEAALGEFQRRVQPRETATNHAHIGHQIPCEHRMIRLRQAAVSVIGGSVLGTGVHARHPDSCV
ncbi:hypothetical protein D3C71_1364080 [compost metagenome]